MIKPNIKSSWILLVVLIIGLFTCSLPSLCLITNTISYYSNLDSTAENLVCLNQPVPLSSFEMDSYLTNSDIELTTITTEKEDKEDKEEKEVKKSSRSTAQIKKNSSAKSTKQKRRFSNWGSFKAYMDYRAITDSSSEQYKLQTLAHTGKHGCRMINNKFMIATGSYYGDVGDTLKITLEDGSHFLAIKGDEKADCDTDANNRVCIHNDSIIEFIVDMDSLTYEAKIMGDLSALDQFEAEVKNIQIV